MSWTSKLRESSPLAACCLLPGWATHPHGIKDTPAPPPPAGLACAFSPAAPPSRTTLISTR